MKERESARANVRRKTYLSLKNTHLFSNNLYFHSVLEAPRCAVSAFRKVINRKKT